MKTQIIIKRKKHWYTLSKCPFCKKERLVGYHYLRHNDPPACSACRGIKASKKLYKGGCLNWSGYKMIRISRDDKFACMGTKRPRGRIIIKEHRYVMANHLGRIIKRSECIHHKDGNILNNAIENLELYSSVSKHHKEHWKNWIRNGWGGKLIHV